MSSRWMLPSFRAVIFPPFCAGNSPSFVFVWSEAFRYRLNPLREQSA